VTGQATGEQAQEAAELRTEWCQERGGQGLIVHAVVHGGLHCKFDNGSMVRVPPAGEIPGGERG